MKESTSRFLMLAAVAGLTVMEFEQLLQELQLSDLVELSDQYRRLRNAVRSISLQERDLAPKRDIRAVSTEVAKRDILNLHREAGIPQRELAQRMLAILRKQGTSGLRAMREKEGLVRWLDSVAAIVDPSAMVNAAVTALQKDVPISADRWRLARG